MRSHFPTFLARALFAAALFLCTLSALAAAPFVEPGPEVRAPGAYFRPAPGQERVVATAADLVRASSRLTSVERHDLGPLTAAERLRMLPERGRGRERQKIGISRDLAQPVALTGRPSGLRPGFERSLSGGIVRMEGDGRVSWTTAFVSPGAIALRLHFSEAYLPAGSRVFVYTDRGEVKGPYTFDGGVGSEGFWTQSVSGEQVYLEVQIPAAAASTAPCKLAVSQVVHRFAAEAAAAPAAPQDTSCFTDVACITSADFPALNSATHAAAALDFIDTTPPAGEFLCSGALIGALGDTSTPYLLTANHCFSTQASATSLQATFNFKDSTCNQTPFPPEGSPSTVGSTLLATGENSDFTLVRLSQTPPAGSFLLGWSSSAAATSNGTKLYRISHPAPSGEAWPQYFNRESVVASPVSICDDATQANFIYASQEVGGTTGGSSGSPVMLADGTLVGQLLGKCPITSTSDPCANSAFYQLDGAFAVSYPSLAQWLNPSSSGACATGGSNLCLGNGRYKITATWQSPSASGSGTAVQLTPDTGYFWFFNSANVEMVIKVLNACALNSRYWVFAGGLTNVNVVVTVTDTQTGQVRTYTNPQSTAFQPIQDTDAFATCP